MNKTTKKIYAVALLVVGTRMAQVGGKMMAKAFQLMAPPSTTPPTMGWNCLDPRCQDPPMRFETEEQLAAHTKEKHAQ